MSAGVERPLRAGVRGKPGVLSALRGATPAIMLGFRTHQSTSADDRFDPARVGLDHVGFHVEGREQLEAWRSRLDEQGINHSGIVEDQAGLHLSAKDPDNIALEFFCAQPQG
jgi:hypothetical protein